MYGLGTVESARFVLIPPFKIVIRSTVESGTSRLPE